MLHVARASGSGVSAPARTLGSKNGLRRPQRHTQLSATRRLGGHFSVSQTIFSFCARQVELVLIILFCYTLYLYLLIKKNFRERPVTTLTIFNYVGMTLILPSSNFFFKKSSDFEAADFLIYDLQYRDVFVRAKSKPRFLTTNLHCFCMVFHNLVFQNFQFMALS